MLDDVADDHVIERTLELCFFELLGVPVNYVIEHAVVSEIVDGIPAVVDAGNVGDPAEGVMQRFVCQGDAIRGGQIGESHAPNVEYAFSLRQLQDFCILEKIDHRKASRSVSFDVACREVAKCRLENSTDASQIACRIEVGQ